MVMQNTIRDREFGAPETTEERLEGIRLGMHDKTDLENSEFRYVL